MLISNLPYLSNDHKNRFLQMVFNDKTSEHDIERLTFFFILSGNDDIRGKPMDAYYNFDTHSIKRSCKEYYLCSSGKNLLKLAFTLYNSNNKTDLSSLFTNLDKNNFNLAINAIKMRFNRM